MGEDERKPKPTLNEILAKMRAIVELQNTLEKLKKKADERADELVPTNQREEEPTPMPQKTKEQKGSLDLETLKFNYSDKLQKLTQKTPSSKLTNRLYSSIPKSYM